jgi:hypothetical protein
MPPRHGNSPLRSEEQEKRRNKRTFEEDFTITAKPGFGNIRTDVLIVDIRRKKTNKVALEKSFGRLANEACNETKVPN